MSVENNKAVAQRWLDTALDDYDASQIMKKNKKFAHACFLCQQAAEKALKAIFYYIDTDPWGHSVVRLIDELINIDKDNCKPLEDQKDEARVLDRFYIPTRYPNGLPDITPAEAYSAKDADQALNIAGSFIAFAKNRIS